MKEVLERLQVFCKYNWIPHQWFKNTKILSHFFNWKALKVYYHGHYPSWDLGLMIWLLQTGDLVICSFWFSQAFGPVDHFTIPHRLLAWSSRYPEVLKYEEYGAPWLMWLGCWCWRLAIHVQDPSAAVWWGKFPSFAPAPWWRDMKGISAPSIPRATVMSPTNLFNRKHLKRCLQQEQDGNMRNVNLAIIN